MIKSIQDIKSVKLGDLNIDRAYLGQDLVYQNRLTGTFLYTTDSASFRKFNITNNIPELIYSINGSFEYVKVKNDFVYTSNDNILQKRDKYTGQLLWSYTTNRSITSFDIDSQGNVFIGQQAESPFAGPPIHPSIIKIDNTGQFVASRNWAIPQFGGLGDRYIVIKNDIVYSVGGEATFNVNFVKCDTDFNIISNAEGSFSKGISINDSNEVITYDILSVFFRKYVDSNKFDYFQQRNALGVHGSIGDNFIVQRFLSGQNTTRLVKVDSNFNTLVSGQTFAANTLQTIISLDNKIYSRQYNTNFIYVFNPDTLSVINTLTIPDYITPSGVRYMNTFDVEKLI